MATHGLPPKGNWIRTAVKAHVLCWCSAGRARWLLSQKLVQPNSGRGTPLCWAQHQHPEGLRGHKGGCQAPTQPRSLQLPQGPRAPFGSCSSRQTGYSRLDTVHRDKDLPLPPHSQVPHTDPLSRQQRRRGGRHRPQPLHQRAWTGTSAGGGAVVERSRGPHFAARARAPPAARSEQRGAPPSGSRGRCRAASSAQARWRRAGGPEAEGAGGGGGAWCRLGGGRPQRCAAQPGGLRPAAGHGGGGRRRGAGHGGGSGSSPGRGGRRAHGHYRRHRAHRVRANGGRGGAGEAGIGLQDQQGPGEDLLRGPGPGPAAGPCGLPALVSAPPAGPPPRLWPEQRWSWFTGREPGP